MQHYWNYLDWLQQQDLAQAENYWRHAMEGFITPTVLGIDQAPARAGLQDGGYDTQQVTLSEDTVKSFTTTADVIQERFETGQGEEDTAAQLRLARSDVASARARLEERAGDVAEGGRVRLVDPHLDEDRIAEVSRQLGEIMEGEL